MYQTTLPVVKPLVVHFIPTALLVFGSVAVWKLWQQHQKNIDNELQFNTLQAELAEMRATKQQAKPDISPQPIKTTSEPLHPQMQNSSKKALFEQIIDENVTIRGSDHIASK